MRVTSVVLAAGIAAALAYWGWRLRAQRIAAEAASHEAVRALEQRLEQVENAARLKGRRVGRVPVPVLANEPPGQLPAAVSANSVQEKTYGPQGFLTESEAAARNEELTRERTQTLSDQLESEARDAQWARELEAKILDMFPASNPTARLATAECRTATCRVVVEAESADDVQRAHSLLIRLHMRSFASGIVDERSGHVRWTMFLGRPGYSWPGAPDDAERP